MSRNFSTSTGEGLLLADGPFESKTENEIEDAEHIPFVWNIKIKDLSKYAEYRISDYFPASIITARLMSSFGFILLVAFLLLDISYIAFIASLWLLIAGLGMSRTLELAAASKYKADNFDIEEL